MRFVIKTAVAVVISFVLFYLMQLVFAHSICADCGVKVGFPFSYVQEPTFAAHGHIIWLGIIGDIAITLGFTILAIWVLGRKRFSR